MINQIYKLKSRIPWFTNILFSIIVCLASAPLLAQNFYVTELDRAGKNGVWTCVMTEFNLADQIFLREKNFPESAMTGKNNEGYRVSQVAYTGDEFVVLMDKPVDGRFVKQVLYKATENEWKEKLRGIRDSKFSVSEMLFARDTWYIIADEKEIDQVRNYADYIDEDEFIAKRDQKGYYITNARYGEDKWGFVFSKKPQNFSNQFTITDKEFPEKKVKAYWERGYRITDVSFGRGHSKEEGYVWFIVMTKFSGIENQFQTLIAKADFPSKEIAEYRSISRNNRPDVPVATTTPRVVQSPSTTKVYGVFIGVEDYSEFRKLSGGGRSPGDLDFIANDAKMIHEYYKSISDKSMIGELLLLLDKDARKQNILKQCKALFAKADKDDVVIFYFSGHGAVGYFCSYDYNLLHSELSTIFNTCEAKIQICIADACHSGSWDVKGPISKSSWGNALEEYNKTLDTRKAGRCLLMAAQSNQTSLVGSKLKCSVFTYFLKKGLTGSADFNGNKIITIEELFKYLEKEVEKYSCEVEESCFKPQLNGNPDSFIPIGISN